MAEIIPFRGILYNPKKVNNVAKVFAPPYDVISSQQQARYSNDPYNIVHLILGKDFNEDNELRNKYKRAGERFREWLEKGVLQQDETPMFYLYQQQWVFDGEEKCRTGFIGLMRLEEFGRSFVFPHENTLEKPKEDRLHLIREVRANLSPIFSLFSDGHSRVDGLLERHSQETPLFDVEDDNETRHRLWRILHRETIDALQREMASKKIFIADGHHRYEVALKFRDEMRKKFPSYSGSEGWNFVMMYFTNIHGRGLVILPTHRLVKNVAGIDFGKIGEFFHVDSYNRKEDMFLAMERKDAMHTFGMYDGGNTFYLLTLKNERRLDKIMPTDKPEQWKKIDVVILHKVIFDYVLKTNIDEIVFEQNTTRAIEKMQRGEFKVAFFLNPTKITDVINIASSGQRVPEKVTYFYPKLLSGMVMNRLE